MFALDFIWASKCHRFEQAIVAMKRFNAGNLKIYFSGFHQFMHLIDAMLRSAKSVAMVHER